MKRRKYNPRTTNRIPTNRELVRRTKKPKEPKKKHRLFIPELRMEVRTDKDPEEARKFWLWKYGKMFEK